MSVPTTTDLGPALACPFCRRSNPLATSVGDAAVPAEGDVTMCISCGRFAIFAAGPEGLRARRPTYDERQDIAADPSARRLHRTWLEASWRGDQ